MHLKNRSLMYKSRWFTYGVLGVISVVFFLWILSFSLDKVSLVQPTHNTMGCESVIKEGIKRKIFLVKNNQRPEVQITAKKSHFFLMDPGNGKLEYEELFNGLDCYYQEEIFPEKNSQTLRHFSAQEALVDFDSHTLVSKLGIFENFSLPGKEIPEIFPPHESLMSAEAKNVEIELLKKYPKITAKSFQACMNDPSNINQKKQKKS